MNTVGIDVSKGKSTIAVMRSFSGVVASPYDVDHTESELKERARFLKSLPGETRVLMEYTGRYYESIAQYLHESGIFVSVVNAILAHDYSGNSLRKVKTDKIDAVKLANMAIDRWLQLVEYIPEDEIRQTLKICNRQYNQYNKLKTRLKNNLIALLDQTFPGVNKLFTSPSRKSDGHEKWGDFALNFGHCECVCGISERQFKDKYERWYKRNEYQYSSFKAENIYVEACDNVGLLPMCESTKVIVTQAITQLQAIEKILAAIKQEMQKRSSTLLEYNIVKVLYSVSKVLEPQLIAEIGDVDRFKSKKSLIAFAGIDSLANQSGHVDNKSTKRRSASLRKTLFQVMSVIP